MQAKVSNKKFPIVFQYIIGKVWKPVKIKYTVYNYIKKKMRLVTL